MPYVAQTLPDALRTLQHKALREPYIVSWAKAKGTSYKSDKLDIDPIPDPLIKKKILPHVRKNGVPALE